MSARTPDDDRGGAPAPGESRGEPCAPRWARARDALLARLPSWWWPVTDPHVRLAAGTEYVGALAVVGGPAGRPRCRGRGGAALPAR